MDLNELDSPNPTETELGKKRQTKHIQNVAQTTEHVYSFSGIRGIFLKAYF